MTICAADFHYLRGLVLQRSAIVLEEGKEYLVDTRLTSVARHHGFASVQELINTLRSRPFNSLHQAVIEAMTTNETSFFRDVHPFETLRHTVLPEMIAKRRQQQKLTFWSAACSSGQEPYSLALLVREHFPALASWQVHIKATDLSSHMITRARSGRFNQLEVNRGLPATLLPKYFERQGLEWQLRQDICRMVQFQVLNLIEAWASMEPTDIIFMRNVLIYFDTDTKKKILTKVRRVLQPDGYLFLGSSETATIDDSWECVQLGKTLCCRVRDAAREVQNGVGRGALSDNRKRMDIRSGG